MSGAGNLGNVDTLRVLNDEETHRLDVQREADARVETKLLIMLGFSLTLIPILLQSDRESGWKWWAIAVLSLSAAASLRGTWPRDLTGGPQTMENIRGAAPVRVLAGLLNSKERLYAGQVPRSRRRLRAFKAATLCFVAGAALGSLHLVAGKEPTHGTKPTQHRTAR